MKKRSVWITTSIVILCFLLLWWLYVAILVNEDSNEQGIKPIYQDINISGI